MKIVKGIINVFTTLIISVGGIFLILYAFGIIPYVVLSGSMEPTIKTGSLCFVNKHTDIENIKEKDIIAFKLKDGTSSEGKQILIDGQQRVTALTAALLGQEVLDENYKKTGMLYNRFITSGDFFLLPVISS